MIMKECSRCKIKKAPSEFYKNSSRKDGLNYSCKACQKGMTADYTKRSSKPHQRLTKHRKFIRRYKLLCGCSVCGYKAHPAALDLDHKDPEWKKANRNAIRGSERYSSVQAQWSMERIKTEIRQCRVLCSNCHRVKTHGQHY